MQQLFDPFGGRSTDQLDTATLLNWHPYDQSSLAMTSVVLGSIQSPKDLLTFSVFLVFLESLHKLKQLSELLIYKKNKTVNDLIDCEDKAKAKATNNIPLILSSLDWSNFSPLYWLLSSFCA
jgi:hypothetical protein